MMARDAALLSASGDGSERQQQHTGGARSAAAARISDEPWFAECVSTSQPRVPLAGAQLTYGEFDLHFFDSLIGLCDVHRGDVFLDLGSGVGRLVLAAALLRPTEFALCHGIELLPQLHAAATSAHGRLKTQTAHPSQPVAPCEFSCVDLFGGGATDALGRADVLFSYSVTWARDAAGQHLTDLSRTLAHTLKPGARIVTVGLELLPSVRTAAGRERRFEHTGSLSGWNEETGGETVGHVFRVD